jgi:hypothetical protein
MPKYFSILISLLIVFGLLNCQKNENKCQNDAEVTIHLIKNIQGWKPDCSINEDSIELEDEVFIRYDQLLSYDPDKHLFELSEEVLDHIENIVDDLHTRAFAAMIDDEIIFTCYFWAAYSSSICSWYTTDPIMAESYGGLKVTMGYPAGMYSSDQDRRTDDRLLCVFDRDGKLK